MIVICLQLSSSK